MPTSGFQNHLVNPVNLIPHDGLWLADEELAEFLDRHFPKPIRSTAAFVDPTRWRYLRADVDAYYRKAYRFLERRLLAFRVRFPDHERSSVEPTGGLVARLRCFLEEAAIKAELSTAVLLDQLEADSNNRSPFDRCSLEFLIQSIRTRTLRLRLALLATADQPVDENDRSMTWIYITAGGGKTGAFVPLN